MPANAGKRKVPADRAQCKTRLNYTEANKRRESAKQKENITIYDDF